MLLSKKLISREGGLLAYWCAGCGCTHQIAVGEGGGPRWGWNGDAEKPTFTPSVLWRYGHFATPEVSPADCYICNHADDDDRKCMQCHTFIADGRVQYLSDCTHPLAGQTVDLPELPDYLQATPPEDA